MCHSFEKKWDTNETHLCDNKKFWGVVKHLLSYKAVYNEKR